MYLVDIFKRYLSKRTILYLIAFTFLIFSEILQVIPPKLIGDIIDSLTSGNLTQSKLISEVILLVAIALFHFVVIYIWSSSLFGGEFFIQKELRKDMFYRTLYNKKAPNDQGNALTIMNNDINTIGSSFGFGILSFMSTVIGLLVIFTMSIMISWKLTIVSLPPMLLIIFVVKRLGKQVHQNSMDVQDKKGYLNNHSLEFFNGLRLIRIFMLEKKYVESFFRLNQGVTNSEIVLARTVSMFHPIIVTLIRINYVITLGYGSYLIAVGDITIGALITFLFYINLLHWPIRALGDFINFFQQGNASASRFIDYVDNTKNNSSFTRNIKSLTDIRFEHFSLRRGNSNALSDVNLIVRRGENIAIVGKTGSGKSSLISFFAGEYDTYEGSASISNVPYREISQKNLSNLVAYVPQEPSNLSKTIYENLILGSSSAKEKIEEVLQITSLHKEVKNSNLTLNSSIGGSGKNLSGGQLQKLALSRALLKNSELLLLDDIFSFIDSKSAVAIFEKLLRFRREKTNIIVTNNFELTQRVDKIIVLIDGKVVEMGSHETLIQSNTWYSNQYRKFKELSELEEEERRLQCE